VAIRNDPEALFWSHFTARKAIDKTVGVCYNINVKDAFGALVCFEGDDMMKKLTRFLVSTAAAVLFTAMCGVFTAFADVGSKEFCFTGDNRHIIIAVAVLIIAGAAAAVSAVLIAVKKRKRSR